VGVLNFSGSLPVAVVLHWKGDVIKNALSDFVSLQTTRDRYRDHEYVIANELVTSFSIVATEPNNGPPIVTIDRQAAPRKRFFDDKIGTYTTNDVPAAALERLFGFGSVAPCTITMMFTFDAFFHHLLLQMTRTDAAPQNLANPSAFVAQTILDSFVHTTPGGKVHVDYKRHTTIASDIPCKLSATKIDPNPKDPKGPPSVKLTFDLDLVPKGSVQRDLMLQLIATDWTELARLKRDPELDLPVRAETWFQNVRSYLYNHTDMQRGERLRGEIMLRHKGKEPATLVRDLRDDIDRHLITANHWGQKREDMKNERYQALLSDLFGTLHQDSWHASPVAFNRSIVRSREVQLTTKERAALAIQYGTGHCGEHADVSFSLIADLIADPGSKVKIAVKSGNANIDHDFVVVDLDPQLVVRTKTTNALNPRLKKTSKDSGADKEIDVWNLSHAIDKTPRPGLVLDPYLDLAIMAPDPKRLLVAIRGKGAAFATDFIAFNGVAPRTADAAIPRDDIRTKSLTERRARVPNV
jgi:hypothetical protein